MLPESVKELLLSKYDKFMYLKIYVPLQEGVENSAGLKDKYLEASANHNNRILNPENKHPDAGFDLFIPRVFTSNNIDSNQVLKVNHEIICAAEMLTDSNKIYHTGYYLHPRSSICKTRFRLSNSTGIIDAGYRGYITGLFDVNINININTRQVNTDLSQFDRLLQICAPGLVPIYVEVVNLFEELGQQTMRGANGIGSTGN